MNELQFALVELESQFPNSLEKYEAWKNIHLQ